MRKQIAPLAAAFTFPAAKDLPERGLHVGRLHNLLDDMTNSAHKYLFLFLIRGLQSPGPGFFEPFPAYQTLPDTLFFSFPAPKRLLLLRLASLGTTVGTSPRCCTPIKISFRLLFRREPTFVFVFEKSLFAFDIETPPFGFALLLPR